MVTSVKGFVWNLLSPQALLTFNMLFIAALLVVANVSSNRENIATLSYVYASMQLATSLWLLKSYQIQKKNNGAKDLSDSPYVFLTQSKISEASSKLNLNALDAQADFLV